MPLKALIAIKVPARRSPTHKRAATWAIRDALLISKAAMLTSAKKASSGKEREGDFEQS
jgi:hypothetical protein